MREALHETTLLGGANRLFALWLAAACALVGVAATDAASSAPAIQKCQDAQGRPIASDPSDRRCYTPPKTPEELARLEAIRAKELEAYNACKAEQRSLQSLVSRYPTKDKHDAARAAALSQIDATLRASERRLEQLKVEHKRLLDEAEFYPSGNLPAKLRRDIDANSALIEAQTLAIANQKDEAAQKNAFYDGELAKLQKLWLPQRDGTRGCVRPSD